MKCNICGQEVPSDSAFCPFCGAKIEQPAPAPVQQAQPVQQPQQYQQAAPAAQPFQAASSVPPAYANVKADTGAKKSNLSKIIIAIAAVLVVGVIGLFVGKSLGSKGSSTPTPSSTTETPTVEQPTEPEPEPEPSAPMTLEQYAANNPSMQREIENAFADEENLDGYVKIEGNTIIMDVDITAALGSGITLDESTKQVIWDSFDEAFDDSEADLQNSLRGIESQTGIDGISMQIIVEYEGTVVYNRTIYAS
ncbi:MAG: zinc ribbon domain-containing protein [Mogibacterium sp.]|nr:zinc ribbon domain-containing protein [Mogibacterium sp.]